MAARPADGCPADPGALPILHRAMRDAGSDPVRILEGCLRRINAVEDRVQGFCLIDADGAMAQAEKLRAEATKGRWRGPLHGVPVAIKDVINVAGWPTRAGSRTRKNAAASESDAL